MANLVEATHRKPALAPVRDAVVSGALTVPVAQVLLAEFDELRPRIIAEAHELVLDGLIRIRAEDGAREVRRLRTALVARYGASDEFQRDQDRAARLVALSHPVCTDEGVWEYRFTADAEAKAILDAAIGMLSAPWHSDGARDPRSAAQRRGQALVEVCRRVTAAAKAAGVFGGYPDASHSTPQHPPSRRQGPRRAGQQLLRPDGGPGRRPGGKRRTDGRCIGRGGLERPGRWRTQHRNHERFRMRSRVPVGSGTGPKRPGRRSARR